MLLWAYHSIVLDGPGIESRWGARFSSPVQNGPGAHPASCRMGTGSFPEVKRPGRGVDHPPTSSAQVKERVELYLCSPSGLSWPFLAFMCVIQVVCVTNKRAGCYICYIFVTYPHFCTVNRGWCVEISTSTPPILIYRILLIGVETW